MKAIPHPPPRRLLPAWAREIIVVASPTQREHSRSRAWSGLAAAAAGGEDDENDENDDGGPGRQILHTTTNAREKYYESFLGAKTYGEGEK